MGEQQCWSVSIRCVYQRIHGSDHGGQNQISVEKKGKEIKEKAENVSVRERGVDIEK